MAYRPKDTQERVLHRLKIARGHLEKVINMVEEDKYCIDVLQQLSAVNSGLEETANVLLEHHLRTCASEKMKKGKTDEAIEEIMTVFNKK